MKTTSRTTMFAVLPSALLVAVAGCGVAPASVADPTAEPVAQESEAVTLGGWTDWSGQVEFRLYMCPAVSEINPASNGLKIATCSVDADFAVTGGGAEICSVDPGGSACPPNKLQWNPGALLVTSSPVAPGSWIVAATTWAVQTQYWLRAYAIGMRLNGSVWGTRPFVTISDAHFSSYVGPNAPTRTYCPGDGSGYLLIGGGGGLSWTGSQPDFLYESTANWYTSSSPFNSTTRAYCKSITVPACIPGFGCLQKGLYTWNGASVSTGYASSSFQVPFGDGWALSSIGGSTFGGYYRFLTDMLPQFGQGRGGVTIWSKDHLYTTPGSVQAVAVVVAKQ